MVGYLQWIGCAFGVLGAFLLALNTRLSGWGFVSFLVSNGCWIVYGVLADAPGLVAMQTAFTATSLLGIYRWLWAKPTDAMGSRELTVDAIYNPRGFRARKSGG
jgi:hypothetical protein